MTTRVRWVAVFAAVLAVAAARPAQAQGDSGFLRGKGNLDVSLSYTLDTYDSFWIGRSKVNNAPFGRVSRQTMALYAAYGLTNNVDLALNVPYVWTHTDEIFPSEQDFQNFWLAGKWRFASWRLGPGRLNLLAFPGIQIPLTDYENNAVNAIGDGEIALLFHGIVQYEFDSGVFAAVETGYDWRFSDVPDTVPVNFTLGATFGQATLTGWYMHLGSLSGYNIGQGPFYGVDEEWDRIGAGVYIRLTDRFGISGNVYTTLNGKNTGDVDGFSVGVTVRF